MYVYTSSPTIVAPPPPLPPHSRFEKKCWKGEARRIRGLALPAKRRILSNTTPRGVMRIVGETTTNGESCFERDKLCCAISWGNINEMYLRNFATGWELIKEFLKYISKCIFARWNILYKRERRRKERKRGGGSVVSGVADIGEKELRWGSLDLKSLLRAECYKRKALCTRVSKYY